MFTSAYQNERIGEIVGVTGKWVRNVLTAVYNKLSVQGEIIQALKVEPEPVF